MSLGALMNQNSVAATVWKINRRRNCLDTVVIQMVILILHISDPYMKLQPHINTSEVRSIILPIVFNCRMIIHM